MFENILTIIPARAGSKRFPNKNMAEFNGKSLVWNTVDIAQKAGLHKIIITTDIKENKSILLFRGDPNVSIMPRPLSLATDDATMEDVVDDVVTRSDNWGIKFDSICLMQCTSPLLRPKTLEDALKKYDKYNLAALIAINPSYKPCGAFYIVHRIDFEAEKKLFLSEKQASFYMLGWQESVDVDYDYDLKIAKAISGGWGLIL